MSNVIFAPAKINLSLAITGVREDGFHSLVSVVAPVSLGDELRLEANDTGCADAMECGMAGVPCDGRNLVLRAAAAFRRNFPALPRVRFFLKKNVSHGAGLGGGSSDAVAALRLLNDTFGRPLSDEKLLEIAAELGSDCPLFLAGKPVIMRGRGEKIEPLSDDAAASFRGKKVLIFKPDFSVSTAEAFAAMRKKNGTAYVSENDTDAALSAWKAAPRTTPFPFFNTMEGVIFEKHFALPAMFEILENEFSLSPRMSGSGSASFVFLENRSDTGAIEAAIHRAWGATAFARIAEIL